MAGDKVQEELHRTLASATDLDNEKSVADHMQKVMAVLIDSYPDCALEKLEEVSFLIRNGHDLSKFLIVNGIDRDYRSQAKDLAAYIEKTVPLFVKPKGGDDEEEEVEADAPVVCMIQDLLADERLFNCAGIGFGQQEGYLLQKSLQKLAAEKSATFLRFFGKIRCTQTDYYIAEATVEGGEDAGGDDDDNENAEAKDPDQEEKGTGVNKYTYFVTNSPFAPWKMLPDIAPSHIQAARKIKVLFHGDLERDITVNPFFFGKEKHLLRAQIARIAQSTMLTTKGQYKLNEEDLSGREIDENIPEDETKENPLPTTSEAAKVGTWVHFNASILNNCKTIHEDPAEEAPEGFEGEYDIEQEKQKIEQADPFEPRLKPISGDDRIKMGGKLTNAPWTVRLVGDPTEYHTEQGKSICHGVAVVRSLIWPGAFTLYQNGKQTAIYVGDGSKFSDKLKPFPLAPPQLNMDPVEYGEFVLPEIKVLTFEEIGQKIEADFDEIWGKHDTDDSGFLAEDDIKKLAADIKAKVNGKEEAEEVNEQAVAEAFGQAEKNEDDKLGKDLVKTIMINIFEQL